MATKGCMTLVLVSLFQGAISDDPAWAGLNFDPWDNLSYTAQFPNATVYPNGATWNAALIQRVVTLTIIMCATLLGNSIIVAVLARSRYRKRSSRVNIFVLNLAIGDLAVCCITMTSELLFEVFGEWVLGNAACKGIVYGQIVTLASTTFILTSMTYDRYQAICRPLKSCGGVAQAKRLIAASWLLAFVLAIPQIFIFLEVENGVTSSGRTRYECLSRGYTNQWQRKLYFTWLTSYILIFPLACICFCYVNVMKVVWEAGQVYQETKTKSGISTVRRSFKASSSLPRAKVKTLKLTLCIIISFIVCWTPYFIIHNIRIYSDYSVQVHPNITVVAETLALLNSALNPVFYGYFNARVRKGFAEILGRRKQSSTCPTAELTQLTSTLTKSDIPRSGTMLEMSRLNGRAETNGRYKPRSSCTHD